MLSEEVKRDPIYLEALGLMQAPKEGAVDKWHKGKLKQAKKDYGRVSEGMFSAYETSLNQYAAALKAAHALYQSAGTARKENILEKLITKDRKNLANAIKTMDKYRNTYKPVSRQSTTPKSGAWKRFLVWTGLAAALAGGGGYLLGNKNSQQRSAPDEADRMDSRMEQQAKQAPQKYNTPQKRSSSDASLLPRLQKSIDQSMADVRSSMSDDVFYSTVKGRQQRNVISGLDVQGSANQAAIANNMAKTSAAKRAINYNEQRMKVDTVESYEDTVSSLRRTLEESQRMVDTTNRIIDSFHHHGRK